jgi:serine/threonine protein kinase
MTRRCISRGSIDPRFTHGWPRHGSTRILGGKYRILRLELDHEVAIKLLRAELASDPSAVERFVREARAAARIVSPHVVRILDVARTDDGAPYIVMEYLEGEDLSRRVERGPVPVEEAIDYVLQACVAIGEAHRVGVIHRDLKPANLFLAKRRSGPPILKVVDFGISKLAPRRGRIEAVLTAKDALMGTPFYMAPEQLQGGVDADGRSDIWALGLVAFELMTGGSGPFEAPTLPELCTRIISDRAVRLSEALTDGAFPPGLEEIIDRCLTKDPNGRYQNVEDLAAALAPFSPHSLALTDASRKIGDEITPMDAAPPSSRGTWAPVISSSVPRPAAASSVSRVSVVYGVLGVGTLDGSRRRRRAIREGDPGRRGDRLGVGTPRSIVVRHDLAHPRGRPGPHAATSSAPPIHRERRDAAPCGNAATARPKHVPTIAPRSGPSDEFGGRH